MARNLILAVAFSTLSAGAAFADTVPATQSAPEADTAAQAFAVHGQLTNIWQYHPAFKSPYEGTNSLQGGNHTNETTDLTAYVGARIPYGAELWWNPEMDQGIAPSDTLGVAGYVNGDGAKVGKRHPYFRTQRLFIRKTWNLGGASEKMDPDLNKLAGAQSANRITLTFGKLNVTDIFDDNAYAHDPKGDFLNWSIIDGGAYDYAADAWGYSYGGALEWRQGDFTYRFGVFDTSKVPNGERLSNNFAQFQYDAEVEYRQTWVGREGKIKLTGFLSRAKLAKFTDAIAYALANGLPADTAPVRRYRSRAGGVVNIEQPLADDLGIFARVSAGDGHIEPYEYADIDRSVQAGASIKGTRWGRKDDVFGIAAVNNKISSVHEAYLAAGGLGILVGDGKLPHPGDERIVEAFYNVSVVPHLHFTADAQVVDNPAYNRDRGPAVVFGGRIHAEF